jgi:hypothetical protein
MLNPHSASGAVHLIQVLASVFLAILFLQSSIDKIVDRHGNLEFLKGHFAKSLLAGLVTPMFIVITIIELSAGILTALGGVLILLARGTEIAFYGAVLAAIALIALFFGQRVAKDYPGAAILVPYFLLTLGAIYLLAQD